MNKRKYIIPHVQFVSMTMPKNVCDVDNPDSGNPSAIGNASGLNQAENPVGAPARIKLYF